MKKIDKHITIINSISNIILQCVNIVSNIIIPRFLIIGLGSEVNGLAVSLTQFLNLMVLLEGGLGSVILAHLYKPLFRHDYAHLSQVVATIRKCYRQLSYIFVAYSFAIGILYPIIIKTPFTFNYIASLTAILAFTTFIQYNITTPLRLILNADKKNYITSITQAIVVALNTILSLIILKVFPEIHIVKIGAAIIYLIQPAILSYFTNKFYKIDKHAIDDFTLLKNRWSGLGISVAAFLHFNADVLVLSIFTNLATISVYSVYALIVTGLRQILVAISSGILPTLGHKYAAKDRRILAFFNQYEAIIFFFTTIFFTIGGLLITPFVVLYTSSINDANYHQPLLGIFLVLAEATFCIREPFVNLAYSANRFKDVTKPAIIEAIINIVLSVLLVLKFSVIGVAIGTFIAMLYRTIFHITYTPKIIPKYKPTSVIPKILPFVLSSIVTILLCLTVVQSQINTWTDWTLHGCVYTIICIVTTFLIISISSHQFRTTIATIIFNKRRGR